MRNTRRHTDRSGPELDLREAYARRQAVLMANRPEPKFPSTGTDRVAARLAEARTRQRATTRNGGAVSRDIDLTSG